MLRLGDIACLAHPQPVNWGAIRPSRTVERSGAPAFSDFLRVDRRRVDSLPSDALAPYDMLLEQLNGLSRGVAPLRPASNVARITRASQRAAIATYHDIAALQARRQHLIDVRG